MPRAKQTQLTRKIPQGSPDTPLMQQYQKIKAQYPHAILFFRLGDFYEMFGEDARRASRILQLVLTSRQGVPMCGVPFHASSNYIRRLLDAGEKVAVCEQTEDPAQAVGIVRRQVLRVLTPGTAVEQEIVPQRGANFLVGLCLQEGLGWGMATMDVSTYDFWTAEEHRDPQWRLLLSEIVRLKPAEVLLEEGLQAPEELKKQLQSLTPRCTISEAKVPPTQSFPTELPTFLENRPLAAKACRLLRGYVLENQPSLAPHLPQPQWRHLKRHLQMDESAMQTLELEALFRVLDTTRTAVGSRKMKDWMSHPLCDLQALEARQNWVECLMEEASERKRVQETLSQTYDIERILSRLANGSASPRDLVGLRKTLNSIPEIQSSLQILSAKNLATETTVKFLDPELLGELQTLQARLSRALVENPPAKLSDGGIFQDGWDPALDEARRAAGEGQRQIAGLEAQERARTKIPSLRVGYNSVFGYYLEVTRAHLSKVPKNYERKQTLVNAERFLTPELKEMETKILGAEEKIHRLEGELWRRLAQEVLCKLKPLKTLAQNLATLDVLASLAQVSQENNYVKPKLEEGPLLDIQDGRHPTVEQSLAGAPFVPNDLLLDGSQKQILVLTGPNMSGKSTYLRQNALIVLLAQMGCFVPARFARIGLVDQILTRIGAQDAIARGESTFMVEMRETASILQSATPRSLLLLDEVGRGTSTYDGISIAWAVLEHLYRTWEKEGCRSGPKVLFATHYFELTELAEIYPRIRNVHVGVREWTKESGKTEILFLYKIAPGPADRSYGIHVAELAGLPKSLIGRAWEILQKLEEKRAEPASHLERSLPFKEPWNNPQ
ncbi:MAG: DNA mismatch repair protein MutS [Elusimicrobia bacterium]|nr:DNA mismatch repair protein MutS [Elusimicrobiota bacterium]